MKDGKVEFPIGCILTGIIAALAVISLFYTPYDINEILP